jgi:hypothetical protein
MKRGAGGVRAPAAPLDAPPEPNKENIQMSRTKKPTITPNLSTTLKLISPGTEAIAEQYDPQPLIEKALAHWNNAELHIAQGVSEYIESGKCFLELQTNMQPDAFTTMLRGLPFGESKARKLMKIAGNTTITINVEKGLVPHSWTIMYELTRIDEPDLQQEIDDGKITAATTRRQAQEAADRAQARKEAAARRATKQAEIDKMNADIDARIAAKKAARGAAEKPHDIIPEDAPLPPEAAGVDAYSPTLQRARRDPITATLQSDGLTCKEAVGILIRRYGYDAVADAVMGAKP